MKTASFVCPGIGQLLERRYAMGCCHLTLFLLFAGAFIGRMLWWLIATIAEYRTMSTPGSKGGGLGQVPWVALLFFTAAIVVFIWSVWDAGRNLDANDGSPDSNTPH